MTTVSDGTLITLEGLPPLITPAWTRGPISDSTVKTVAELIDSSGIVEQVIIWRDKDSGERHPGGRPAKVSDRTIVTLLALCAVEGTPLLFTEIEQLAKHRLSDTSRKLLEIPETDYAYSSLWRAFRRFTKVIDGYPAPLNRRFTNEEAKELREGLDLNFAAIMEERANRVANQLLDVTWKLVPREIRRKWKGNIAIDATVVPVVSPNRRSGSSGLADPNAGWYSRTADTATRGPMLSAVGKAKTSELENRAYGYEAHLALMGSNDPHQPAEFPLLAIAIAYARPASAVGESALELLQSLDDRNYPKNYVISDRAYWPGTKAEKLQIPARRLGWKNINDYRRDQLGIQDHFAGSLLIEGNWYCPSIPKPLIDATEDYRNGTITAATYEARIKERARYMLHVKEHKADGTVRLRCPALGPSATVACPLRPASLTAPNATKRVQVTKKPENIGKVCKQQAVTFTARAGAKYRQDVQFLGTEWKKMYPALRNTVEGFNGFVKDQQFENLEASGRRRVRGRTAQFLMTTLLVAAANIRRIRTFIAEHSDPERIKQLANQRIKRQERRTDQPVSDRSPPDEVAATAV